MSDGRKEQIDPTPHGPSRVWGWVVTAAGLAAAAAAGLWVWRKTT